MKFKSLHPQEAIYNWEAADYIVDFAVKNHKRLHGHTLIWDGSVPDWVANYTGDSASWESMVKNHIQTVVSHYKGKIKSWDVVNEALQDNGKYIDNIWYKKLGKDYIARCFIYAHQADPDALLFYNDHSNEASPLKRKAILKLVNNLRSRGVPIHGLGLQMHTRLAQSNEGIAAALTGAAATGLLVHISELDVSIKIGKVRASQFTPELAQLQALKYQFIIKTYNSLPKRQQFGITMWNVSDGDSWLNKSKAPNWPLLFDKDYKPKQSYKAVIEALKTSVP
jgi:endo-1,4-beta-xylanase